MLDAVRVALLLAVAIAPPVILAIRLRNAERSRREPWQALWRAFAWGASIAAGSSIVLEGIFDLRLKNAAILGFPIVAVILVPIIEEATKTLGLRIIRDDDPEPEDGYIYGGAVGLGFAATENSFYVISAYIFAGEQAAYATALFRGVATVALHGAASAIAGGGVWRERYGRIHRGALFGLLAAIAIHVAYNGLAAIALPWALLGAAALAILAYLRIMRRIAVLDARSDTAF